MHEVIASQDCKGREGNHNQCTEDVKSSACTLQKSATAEPCG